MRRISLFCLSVLSLLLIFHVADAQTQPILILADGDIWSFSSPDAEPFRETYWGHSEDLSLSPDGRYVAYGSIPDWLVERDAAGLEPQINYDTHPPTNIWIMEIATRTFTQIATQDEPSLEEPYRYVQRSTPRWSPDSRKIAWLEANREYSTGGLNLVVYDIESETISYGHGDLPGVSGDGGFWNMTNSLTWGETLALSAFSYQLEAGVLLLLDVDSIEQERILSYGYSISENDVQSWRWVQHNGDWYIGLRYVYGWQLWDYETDTYYEATSEPTLQNVNGQGFRLSYDSDISRWTAIQPGGEVIMLPEGMISAVLSPDGYSVAYMRSESSEWGSPVYFEVWENGTISQLFETEPAWYHRNSIAWASMVWRFDGQLARLPELTPVPIPTQNQG